MLVPAPVTEAAATLQEELTDGHGCARARAAAATNRRRLQLPPPSVANCRRRDVREERRAAGGAERNARAWPRPAPPPERRAAPPGWGRPPLSRCRSLRVAAFDVGAPILGRGSASPVLVSDKQGAGRNRTKPAIRPRSSGTDFNAAQATVSRKSRRKGAALPGGAHQQDGLAGRGGSGRAQRPFPMRKRTQHCRR